MYSSLIKNLFYSTTCKFFNTLINILLIKQTVVFIFLIFLMMPFVFFSNQISVNIRQTPLDTNSLAILF